MSAPVRARLAERDILDDYLNPFRDDIDDDCEDWEKDFDGECPDFETESELTAEAHALLTEDKDEHGYGSYPKGQRGSSKAAQKARRFGPSQSPEASARANLHAAAKDGGFTKQDFGRTRDLGNGVSRTVYTRPEDGHRIEITTGPRPQSVGGHYQEWVRYAPGEKGTSIHVAQGKGADSLAEHLKPSTPAREAQAIVVTQARFVEAMGASAGMSLLRTGVTTLPDVPLASFKDDLARKVSLRRVMHHDDPQDDPEAVQGDSRLPQTDPRVNYRYADDKARACSACTHYQAPGGCERVTGMIRAVDTCDLFEPEARPRVAQAVLVTPADDDGAQANE